MRIVCDELGKQQQKSSTWRVWGWRCVGCKNHGLRRFAANVVLVSGVCLLHMSEANVGLALSAPILAGHHGNVFVAMWGVLILSWQLTWFAAMPYVVWVARQTTVFAAMGNNIDCLLFVSIGWSCWAALSLQMWPMHLIPFIRACLIPFVLRYYQCNLQALVLVNNHPRYS